MWISQKGGCFRFPWRKRSSAAEYYGNLCFLAAVSTRAFLHLYPPMLSSCLSSPIPGQEQQFPFPLLFLFLPFICNSLFSFLCILGCCGKEYAVRRQPSLWDKWVGEEPQTELAPSAAVTEASGKCCYRTRWVFLAENPHSLLTRFLLPLIFLP